MSPHRPLGKRTYSAIAVSLGLAVVAAWAPVDGVFAADQATVNERMPLSGMQAGEAVYLANCAACHQPTGAGLPGAFPPLAGSDYLLDDPARALTGLLQGLTGPITVNGTQYNSVMPPQGHLSDQDLANVMTYILNSWGNRGGEIKECNNQNALDKYTRGWHCDTQCQ